MMKDMSDHDMLIWLMSETRGIKKLLSNHLSHHEKQDDRRWKLYIGIILIVISAAVAMIVS